MRMYYDVGTTVQLLQVITGSLIILGVMVPVLPAFQWSLLIYILAHTNDKHIYG